MGPIVLRKLLRSDDGFAYLVDGGLLFGRVRDVLSLGKMVLPFSWCHFLCSSSRSSIIAGDLCGFDVRLDV